MIAAKLAASALLCFIGRSGRACREAPQRTAEPTMGARPMNILGINAVYHESAAALLVDGKLVCAVEEERFNRIKHAKEAHYDNPHQFPERAIRWCLKHAGLAPDDIDHVAYSFDPKLRRKRFDPEW